MKTDDLIQQLALDLKPVKALPSPYYVTSFFGIFGLLLIGLSFLMMTARQNLTEQLLNVRIQFELLMSFILALSSLLLSVFLSRPGKENTSQILQKVVFICLLFVVAYDGFRVAQINFSQIHDGLNLTGLECFFVVFGYSVILGGGVIYWLQNGATVNPHLSGLVVGTASVALGNILITFFCGVDNGMHTLLWHFTLPLIAALLSGVGASRYLLKW